MSCSIALLCRMAEVSRQASPQVLCNALWAASVLLRPASQAEATASSSTDAEAPRSLAVPLGQASSALQLLMHQLQGQH